MQILSTIVIGLVVGLIARALLPGEQKLGWILTCLLGIGGSLLAQFAGQAMGWYGPGQASGWIASVVAAIVLLFIGSKLSAGSKPPQ